MKRAWPVSDIRLMPRHQFARTGVGCGWIDHEPSCLCDVNIDQPTPIRYGSNIMFGKLALEVLDDTKVRSGNFYNWASLTLGMYDKFRTLPNVYLKYCGGNANGDEETMTVLVYDSESEGVVRQENSKLELQANTPWSSLPKHVRDGLLESARSDMSWELARLQLPLWTPPAGLPYIKRHYGQRRARFSLDARKKDQK